MNSELVERRRWISEQRFLHALNYCMLLPGPEAQQLATYIGWLMHRTWRGIVAGALFSYGIKPAVTALALHAAQKHYGPALIDDHTPTPPHARFSRARLAAVLGTSLMLWLMAMGWFFTKAATPRPAR